MKTFPALLCAAGVFLSNAARADVKLVQRVTIDNAQLKSMMAAMSPDQKAQMAQLGFTSTLTTTMYLHGAQARTDFGQSTVIVDGTHHTMTQINRLARTYSVQPYHVSPKAASIRATVHDTGQSKLVLGRPTHHYTLQVTNPSTGTKGISGDLWVAAGLPTPPFSALPGGALQAGLSQIKGLPLLSHVVLNGGQGGKTTVNSVAQSVSVAPLPASAFAVPPGYTKTPPGTSPMPGAMMGGLGQ